jgi:hypothetical protein|tara:strand:+ start:1756 stop:2091 length:336 start_codon:yes stop_codon:yes gene_type:complete
MTAKNIIDQIEKMFGRQPEQYMFQLINDALDEVSSKKMNNTESKTTDLIGHDRWYALSNEMIQIDRVEIKDTNNRYVMIPKLADSHKLLRGDTDDNNTNWNNTIGEDDSLT